MKFDFNIVADNDKRVVCFNHFDRSHVLSEDFKIAVQRKLSWEHSQFYRESTHAIKVGVFEYGEADPIREFTL